MRVKYYYKNCIYILCLLFLFQAKQVWSMLVKGSGSNCFVLYESKRHIANCALLSRFCPIEHLSDQKILSYPKSINFHELFNKYSLNGSFILKYSDERMCKIPSDHMIASAPVLQLFIKIFIIAFVHIFIQYSNRIWIRW